MTYFISGHRDLTWEEFCLWYGPKISEVIFNATIHPTFVIGTCIGCDEMAIKYLHNLGVSTSYVVLYALRNDSEGIEDNITLTNNIFPGTNYEVQPYRIFNTWMERDERMTKDSDKDIVFLRDTSRWDSGSAQNILRRWTKSKMK